MFLYKTVWFCLWFKTRYADKIYTLLYHRFLHRWNLDFLLSHYTLLRLFDHPLRQIQMKNSKYNVNWHVVGSGQEIIVYGVNTETYGMYNYVTRFMSCWQIY